MSPQMLINGFLNVADKITRSLNIIFVDKKYDVSILSNYIFGFARRSFAALY